MARYIGPKSKIARRFKEPLFGPDKALEKRNYPPGQHGQTRKRAKQSEYAVQLSEKQKAKYTYGLLERQFAKTFNKAAIMKGITGENLLKLLEARLDNTVFRLGIAKTRSAARQFVSHRHITVNGEVVNIPSYQLKQGDVIAVREKSKSLEAINDSLASRSNKFSWLQWDATALSGTFLGYPEREQIPENIKEQLIVELYSK
ncbi:MAG TPA: 30S ribosomal protein S4 [Bacteroidia bacterium]|jgi:small subunit ribosomal protein S4|nr:30S ribosomal protein S4 [Bacteroidia bacterium]MBP7261331.1 30S ribosomal protein S4 [Bacteroidia bacterium]MBP9180628.1 30S ribosomal protein S4 [Bacteroidia bacterium]MBP9724966.1 30S ribosomal protein S4 [Bacteroidia bacterium]HLP34123.1 30S ribosomal protein S4 [Bacteroidia bacterium]